MPQALLLASGASTSTNIVYSKTISAMSASISAISFKSLDTASFKQWKLACQDVTPVSAVAVGLQIGEGSTPTWKTSGSYRYAQMDNVIGTVASASSGTATMFNLGLNAYNSTQAAPAIITATTGDLGYGRGTKMLNFNVGYFKIGSGLASATGSGYWNGDTNAITAIRVIATSGNLNGTCTLEGRP